jgi:aminoglycoside phosphotransferase (APT) family kinase protein
MVCFTILKVCFTNNNQQSSNNTASTFPYSNQPTISSSMLTHYRNFFSRTVQTSEDLDSLLASLSQKLRRVVDVGTEEVGEDYDAGSEDSDSDIADTLNKGNPNSASHKEVSEPEIDEEEEDYLDRWGSILAIPSSSFTTLAQRLTASTSAWKVERRLEGSFNHAVILTDSTTRLVIKVPIVATLERWQAPQAEIMSSAAHTMEYIKSQLPEFPVPGIVALDTSFGNEIGAPFVAETFMAGKSAYNVWYEKTKDGLYDYHSSDFPSPERERIRINFLQSLAKYMAQLHSLEFDSTGMLQFERNDPKKPKIGPFHDWRSRIDESQRKYVVHNVCTTSAEYYATHLRTKCLPSHIPKTKALSMIMESIFQSAPFNQSKKHEEDEKETFTFLHDDLDLQNILCTDTGEVTGIIDWDKVSAVPRCVGATSVPIFLREDWNGDYMVAQDYIHSPWTLNRYRKVYADAMLKYCGQDSDAKYTKMSHIYGVIQRMLFGDHGDFLNRVNQLVPKLLVEIPELRRVDLEPFLEDLGGGDGWKEAECVMCEGIPKVLDYRNV